MDTLPDAPPSLREQAELAANTSPGDLTSAAFLPSEATTLLHELKVHQIELEMQNEELRRTQAEMEISRARYFDLFDLAPVGYLILSEIGLILEANFATATLLGVPRKTLVGQRLTGFLDRSSQDVYHLFRKLVIEKETLHDCELLMVKSSGEGFWTHMEAIAARDPAGTCVIRVTLTDISERKRAEDDLRISAVAFESISGMFVTDASSTIQRVNAAFTDITGYEAGEAIGQNPRMLKSGRHDAAFYEAIWAQVKQSGSWEGEIWNRRKGGDIFPEWLSITVVKDLSGGTSNYIGSFTDITARKLYESEIQNLAFYDPLTQLPNRRLLMDRLDTALAVAVRHQRQGALLFVDLDDFKVINDTLGHDKGDMLLQQIAQRLGTCTREGDTVARLGGDEFVVLLESLAESTLEAATQAEAVGEKILIALNDSFQIGAHAYSSSASIGVTLFGDSAEGIDEPLKRADMAMYQAKAAGRNTLRFFDPETQLQVQARAELADGIRAGLAGGQFQLFYQVQVDVKGAVTGVEGLLRWLHPLRGLVSPGEFIPLAEENGLILPLGKWVLEEACRQLHTWSLHRSTRHLSISVNVSARQFSQSKFCEQVILTLERTGAPARLLKLELTESVMVKHVEEVISKMVALKGYGVGFSLDDFGTGYSSLSYLKRLPIFQLKIDRGFVKDVLVDANDAAIARMVVALADSLGLSVIAEGVETLEQRQLLESIGCNAYQGYLYGRPMPVAELEAKLRG